MKTELRLHGAVHRVQRTAEYHVIEFFYHLTGSEFSQIAPLAA